MCPLVCVCIKHVNLEKCALFSFCIGFSFFYCPGGLSVQVALALPELRMARSYPGPRPKGHSPWQIAAQAIRLAGLPKESSGGHWPVTPGARPPHPRGLGGWRVTRGSAPPKGAARRCRRRGASRGARGTFTGRADNGPGRALSRLAGLPRARRAAAALPRGPGHPPAPPPPAPAAPRRRRPPPSASSRASSPRPRGPRARRGRRKSLVGWPRQRHARQGPGKQRGDVCGRKSGNGAPVGAGGTGGVGRCSPARSLLFAERTSTRA